MIRNGTYASPALDLINLANNPLQVIEPGAFANTPNLRVLFLADCQLRAVPIAVHEIGGSLVVLLLGLNRISKVDESDFVGMTALKMLEVRAAPAVTCRPQLCHFYRIISRQCLLLPCTYSHFAVCDMQLTANPIISISTGALNPLTSLAHLPEDVASFVVPIIFLNVEAGMNASVVPVNGRVLTAGPIDLGSLPRECTWRGPRVNDIDWYVQYVHLACAKC